MADENLSRAVALRALVADLAARLRRGERPNAIRSELLAEGLPPEVIEHVFAVCESTPPSPNRLRTIIALTLSAALMLGLPLAGAFGGVCAAIPTTVHDPEATEGDTPDRSGWWVLGIPVFVGLSGLAGFAIGLAIAVPAVRILSKWSMNIDPNEYPSAQGES